MLIPLVSMIKQQDQWEIHLYDADEVFWKTTSRSIGGWSVTQHTPSTRAPTPGEMRALHSQRPTHAHKCSHDRHANKDAVKKQTAACQAKKAYPYAGCYCAVFEC